LNTADKLIKEYQKIKAEENLVEDDLINRAMENYFQA